MITAERLRELFSYNPETGEFTRLVYVSPNAQAGQVIKGCKVCNHLGIRADGKLYYAHRLAWLYVHGEFPAKGIDVDHINRDKCDNRIANLRLASRTENNRNRRMANKNSRSGVLGIHHNQKRNVWVALITVDYETIKLGAFATKEQAVAARLDGERRYFGRAA